LTVRKIIRFDQLPTEQNNPATRRIDALPLSKALALINQEDRKVAIAVKRTLPQIERAVKMIVSALKSGGRLFFIGAGTSGRLGVLEAAECPPTFNTPPSMVQAFMAGGRSSVFHSKEGAEDCGSEGAAVVQKNVTSGDVVVGIAASGVTPFVRDGLAQARKRKARTVLVTCSLRAPRDMADHTIAVYTGPEVIAGSTRLKAGTATKLVLNSLTVATMIQLGKVYGNRMVDLQPKSKKLMSRAALLVTDIGRVLPVVAKHLLRLSGGNAKKAIVMARRHVTAAEAQQLLQQAGGHLVKVLGAQ
jgi:N-acetylmuramic acid 6-phosphate etherase